MMNQSVIYSTQSVDSKKAIFEHSAFMLKLLVRTSCMVLVAAVSLFSVSRWFILIPDD